jgi:organic hydroperoxide reductase OsmC/OhrA
MANTHHYQAKVVWSGAAQGPTETYEGYSREYLVEIEGKPSLKGSADPTFRGDPKIHNPEDLLVASLSACHMLTYLALCARGGIKVKSYEDRATGTMTFKDGKMGFTEVVLSPKVTLEAGSDLEKAKNLHEKAHDQCFIANSVNFPVRHEARVSG